MLKLLGLTIGWIKDGDISPTENSKNKNELTAAFESLDNAIFFFSLLFFIQQIKYEVICLAQNNKNGIHFVKSIALAIWSLS